MRLIDADALLSDIERTIEESGCVNHEGEIMDCVRYAPTVDPVVHGEWIEQEDRWPPGQYQCSVCHIGNNINTVKPSEFRYCWYCGAKMGKSEAASGVQDL